jgi:hypothetical protein
VTGLLDRLEPGIAGLLERRRGWLVGGLLALYTVVTAVLAWQKLLWEDELYTLYISRVPTIADMWAILSTAIETIPPSFHILARASTAALGEHPLVLRLPEILGVGGMSLCLFWIVSRRSSTAYGAVAMFIPLVTSAYPFAYEARPYGILLGLAAVSMRCWQSVTEGGRRTWWLVGLGAALATALASHYYAVLLFVPLVAGELVRSVMRRRLDLPVWITFVAATAPLAVFLPLIRSARAVAGTFWSKPRWSSMIDFYQVVLDPVPLLGILLLFGFYAIGRPRRGNDPVSRAAAPGPPLHEVVAAAGYLTIPACAVLGAKLVTNAFVERYALPAVIGLAIILSWGAYQVLDRRATLGVALLVFLCAWFVLMDARPSFLGLRQDAAGQAYTYRFLRDRVPRDLPIVIASPHAYFQLTYYAPPDLAPRLAYLADVSKGLRYLGTDGIDRGLLVLARWEALRVEDYRTFVMAHPRFVVLGRTGQWIWVLRALTEEGVPMRVLSQHGDDLLILVGEAGNLERPLPAAHDAG